MIGYRSFRRFQKNACSSIKKVSLEKIAICLDIGLINWETHSPLFVHFDSFSIYVFCACAAQSIWWYSLYTTHRSTQPTTAATKALNQTFTISNTNIFSREEETPEIQFILIRNLVVCIQCILFSACWLKFPLCFKYMENITNLAIDIDWMEQLLVENFCIASFDFMDSSFTVVIWCVSIFFNFL